MRGSWVDEAVFPYTVLLPAQDTTSEQYSVKPERSAFKNTIQLLILTEADEAQSIIETQKNRVDILTRFFFKPEGKTNQKIIQNNPHILMKWVRIKQWV